MSENFIVVAFRDRVIDAFGDPTVYPNEAAAVRSFRQACEKSPIGGDLELFALGSFDRKRGVLLPLENPSFITSGGVKCE